jgi:eukaryotic-like serine/threonine-protein kinase
VALIAVKLPRGEWYFDDARQLGPAGGFGSVYEGQDAGGRALAVKRLHLSATDAAHRELTIADELATRTFDYVLPVLDAGQDPDTGSYFLVMPRADQSLKQYLRAQGTPLGIADAARILRQIVSGLSEVPDIVHRDLKPGNVLLHENRWKIADFGIARFVEASTSLNTLRDCLTPPYAAPEQWRSERSTSATDVYALGCIGHLLLIGRPPFSGPSMADYARQHQFETAPILSNLDSRLRSILAASLRKPPTGRPTLSRLAVVLAEVAANPTGAADGLQALREANASDAERASDLAARAAAQMQRDRERDELIAAGEQVLRDLAKEMATVAGQNAPEARIVANDRMLLSVQLGPSSSSAKLELELQGAVPRNVDFARVHWDLFAIGQILVQQRRPDQWSHGATLWFMRLRGGEARWFEVSYKRHVFTRGPSTGPFPIQELGNDIYAHAEAAAGPGMHVIEIESGPTAIDDEMSEAFTGRWLARLALAYDGRLRPF